VIHAARRTPLFESEFLSNTPAGRKTYQDSIQAAVRVLCEALPDQPYSGKAPAALAELFLDNMLPEVPASADRILSNLREVVTHSVIVTHPNTAAHLQCPPLIPALAAEVVISALNQSMDSFDQAPAATILEEKMVRWLCGKTALGEHASGIFTAGGTQSNYMALLLARDACVDRHFGWLVQKRGLPAEAGRLRILCSDVAHFTVEKSASELGLGTDAVVRVPTDGSFRMRVDSLRSALEEIRDQNLIAMAVVGTAGTTDFGSVDPLLEIGELARAFGAWFHVDAAYGSALLFSDRHRQQLRGVEMADSVSLDFHKLFWQPVSCAAFLLRDQTHFRYLKLHADYLNPETHEQLGIPNLVTRSLATSRRFDILKLWISFQALGRQKLAQMIDATIDLARHAAQFIRKTDRLELVHDPTLSCVVFRYLPSKPRGDANALNAQLRQRLFEQGMAVIGHTIVRARQCLKLTCLNPMTSQQQIEELLGVVVEQGMGLERAG